MADIFLERRGARADLVLNRPDKRNAITVAMWGEIPNLLSEAQEDPAVRLLVVRGEGAHFAAGADIAEFETIYTTRLGALANHKTIQAAMRALETFAKPSVAAIRGACVGGGCGLALCADFRYADDTARFGITPGKLGLAYGVGDTRRLVRAVGLSAAKDILFTGRLMQAAEAKDIGLVDRVVAPDALEGLIEALEDHLCAASGYTARTTKQILQMLADGAQEDNDASRQLFADAFDGADFREGFRAFLEKRAPKFS
jgi:enoyl-CoA hydratase/carnithine racemase